MKSNCKETFVASLIGWVEDMTRYGPKQRVSASALLDEVSAVTADLGRGTIFLRSLGHKRSREVLFLKATNLHPLTRISVCYSQHHIIKFTCDQT